MADAILSEPDESFPLVADLPIQTGMPDPFARIDGARVQSKDDWPAQREYLKAMLTHYQYGSAPPRPDAFELTQVRTTSILDGRAVQAKYAICIRRNGGEAAFHFEFVRPETAGRLPAIVKNCFTLFSDPETGSSANTIAHDWFAAEEAVGRGYLLCKFNRKEVAADHADNRDTGVLPLYPEYDWGTIAAWAWAHGVVIDALDRLGLVDMDRLVVTGHSRGGKTALCAGIYDERIAITAPNSSGTGGTGSLRYFEEGQKEQRLAHHITRFPHWWHPRFYGFADREDRLPFDAHTAKALIAPRALINAHARQDYWANPYGTELTYRAAEKVFGWLGSVGQQGIHWRDGGHAQGEEDWLALFDFADWKFFAKEPTRSFGALTYPDAPLPVGWDAPAG